MVESGTVDKDAVERGAIDNDPVERGAIDNDSVEVDYYHLVDHKHLLYLLDACICVRTCALRCLLCVPVDPDTAIVCVLKSVLYMQSSNRSQLGIQKSTSSSNK